MKWFWMIEGGFLLREQRIFVESVNNGHAMKYK